MYQWKHASYGVNRSMLRVLISYQGATAQILYFRIEMEPLVNELLEWRGMELTFATGEGAESATTFCKGVLEGYHAWSESTVALSLRALHTLYTQWHVSVPAGLINAGTTGLELVIEYRASKEDDYVPLHSVSLCREFGAAGAYRISHPAEAASDWPIEIQAADAQPLAVALKLLAFEHGSWMDFSTYPPAPELTIDTDVMGHDKEVSSIVPEYAHAAFSAFMKSAKRPAHADTLFGRKRAWDLFLRT